ncbi:MFS transporter [Hyphomicrobium sp.]|uniref:MFS transporter n=1 Tax=Hyphomicrobium sp. TaxID=82 RepID=UPI000FA1FB44|nr:MFS transporter [Hyphomicrobium sp.]RUP09254.1 MAG: MFS transporter [Hyphomicrobium sp.]
MISHSASSSSVQASSRLWPLLILNFFMADFQAGIGPFLGIFLLAHGWQSGLVGTVMTMGGVAGMLMGIPAGALIDQTRRKRLWVIVAGVCTIAASAIILLSQEFWVVAGSQLATGIAGAVIIPAVTGITLGMVHQKGFVRQNGLNQAFNHAGNMVGAGLSGYLGWKFGFPAVFALAAVFGALSIASVLMIPAKSIDHAAARGMKEDDAEAKLSGLQILVECKPLLILAVALAAFHLGNAAMLPLYGMAVVSNAQSNGPWFVALTVIIAQGTMIVASLIAMRMAEEKGYWLVLLISFIALPIRGLIASQVLVPWGVYPVQMLDGVGAGLQSVAVPGLVARILNGTGRINAGQGAIATMQGLGAALSPVLGGWIAQIFGYEIAFVVLGSFALISVACWLGFSGLLKPACSGSSGENAFLADAQNVRDDPFPRGRASGG